MEESMANAWLQDSRGLVRTNIGDEVYFSRGQDQSESSSLQPSATSHIDFSNSSSSTLSSETTDHYSFFDPYVQSMACKRLTPDPTSVTSNFSSQVFEQLLTCKEADTQSHSTWGIHQQVDDLATTGEPLHQLPGWTQQDYMVEEWQQNSSCTTQLAESSPLRSTETELNHAPWLMEMSGSYESTTLDGLSPVNQLFHSGMVSLDDHMDGQQVRSPFHSTSNEVAAANRKAAARKNRILLRQKSAPHQRGASHAAAVYGNGSPRALKKLYSTKIPREFLMCHHVQGRDMDPLRFLLHKVLQPSDVSNLGRIVISKKDAETHLPYLAMKEGIFITMEDFDTAEQWTFRYRFWPNSRSRMYLLESTGEFVRAHHLKKGDILVLWRNSSRGTFVIRGMVALPCWRASNNTQDEEDKVSGVTEEREDGSKGKTKASG